METKKGAEGKEGVVEDVEIKDVGAIDFVSKMLGSDKGNDDGSAKPAKKAAKKKPEGEEEYADAGEAQAPEKKTKKPAAKPAESDGVASTREIIETTVAATTKAVLESQKKANADEQQKKDESEAFKLTGKQSETVNVLRELEKSNPEKYKGHAKKYEESIKRLADYAADWEKSNPGKKFDEDAPEHESFFEKHDLDWDDEDYDDARIQIRAREVARQETEKLQQDIEQIKSKDKQRDLAPKVEGVKLETAKAVLSAGGEEFDGLINKDGSFNKEKIEELRGKDPVTINELLIAARDSEMVSEEIVLIDEGVIKFDARNNPVHKDINDFAVRKEREFMALPAKDRTDENGRTFLPSSQYHELSAGEKQKHWTFGGKDLIHLYAADRAGNAVKNAKAENEKIEKVAVARGFSRKESAEGAESKGKKSASEQAGDDDSGEGFRAERLGGFGREKPSSPGVSGEPVLAAGKKGAAAQSKDPQEGFLNRFLMR